MKTIKILIYVKIFLLSSNLSWVHANNIETELEVRANNLDKDLQSNVSLTIANKVEFLHKEVQELRGVVEQQEHFLVNLSNILAQDFKLTKGNVALKPYVSSIQDHPVGLTKDQIKYNYAYNLLKEQNFSQAIIEFKDLLVNYSESKYIPYGLYWLGELYLNEHNVAAAEDYFLQIIAKHKDHIKAPEAMLKLGMIEIERENVVKAKDYFEQIIKNYPNSSNAVKIAQTKLDSF